MDSKQSRFSTERGAIIIQVAAALLGLTALSAFVVDYGIMWSARAQVQTAADAAALAGMQALAFDNGTLDDARLKAQKVGLANGVFGVAPDIQITDVTIIDCPPTPGLPADKCIQARAFRNQARSNALPTFFANLAGVSSQGVQAVAVGRAVAADSAECLRPWAVADKWFDTQTGGWSQSATWDPTVGDIYTPPGGPDSQFGGTNGTGFSATKPGDSNTPDFYGYQMILKLSNPGQGQNGNPVYSAGWAMELALDNPAGSPQSTPAYNANITGCTTDIVAPSPYGGTCQDASGNFFVDPTKGCLAVKTGGTGANNATDIANFISTHDPGATWTDGGGATGWQTGVINTTQSPSSRIVPIAVFDVPDFIAENLNGTNPVARVVSIVGFFVEGTCATVTNKESYLQCPGGGQDQAAIVGRLVNYVGLKPGGSNGSFGKEIILVR